MISLIKIKTCVYPEKLEDLKKAFNMDGVESISVSAVFKSHKSKNFIHSYNIEVIAKDNILNKIKGIEKKLQGIGEFNYSIINDDENEFDDLGMLNNVYHK